MFDFDIDEVMAAAEEQAYGLGSDGFCKACGEMQGGCEPDARNYICECCGEAEVFGAMEILIEIV